MLFVQLLLASSASADLEITSQPLLADAKCPGVENGCVRVASAATHTAATAAMATTAAATRSNHPSVTSASTADLVLSLPLARRRRLHLRAAAHSTPRRLSAPAQGAAPPAAATEAGPFIGSVQSPLARVKP